MSYFPEYYGGEMWNRALTNMGNNIAGALEFYQKRHDEMGKTEAELGYLHDSGVIDDKAWARVAAAHGAEKWNVEQGMLDAYKMKQQNDFHQAQMAHLKAETAYELAHAKALGEAPLKQTEAEKTRERLTTQEQVKQERFANIFRDPASVEYGTKGDKGEFLPPKDDPDTARKSPERLTKNATHVRVVGQDGTEVLVPKSTYERMIKQKPPPVKVGQPQGNGSVPTPGVGATKKYQGHTYRFKGGANVRANWEQID